MEAVNVLENSKQERQSPPSREPGVCPVCKGTGILLVGTEIDGERCAIYPLGTDLSTRIVHCPVCSPEKRRPWLAKYSGLEPDEQASRMHDWKCNIGDNGRSRQRRAVQEIMEQVIGQTRPHGLYTFWGDFGSGKTYAQQIILNELRELRLIEGYYAPFAVVLNHLRQMYAAQQDTTSFWDRLLNVPALALDEITRFDESKAWAQERLFELVDTRYRRRGTHLTLFGTNEDPNQRLSPDEAIGYWFSRAREGELLELRGDLRQAVKKEAR